MERNKAIDILKGFGILLMIIGHCLSIPPFLRTFIYSFHMPLFFFIAGYFFKPQDSRTIFKKSLSRLIVPYIIIFSLNALIRVRSLSLLWDYVIAFIQCDGVYQNNVLLETPNFSDLHVVVGCLWFLPAMFWARFIFNFISKRKYNLIYSLILWVASMVISKHINMPLGIAEGMECVVYVNIGYYVKKYGFGKLSGLVCLTIWIVCLFFSHLELASFKSELYVLDIFGALGGTAVMYYISKIISMSRVGIPFQFMGIYSLEILCFHSLSLPVAKIFTTKHIYLIRVLFNISFLFIYVFIKNLIYRIKNSSTVKTQNY